MLYSVLHTREKKHSIKNVMFRFIAHLLIITMLTLNIAWAGDECEFIAYDDSGSLSGQLDNQTPPDFSNTKFDCDDWCHVLASPVALLRHSDANNFLPDIAVLNEFFMFSYCSLSIPPPYHPPIA